jgi:iron complex transport system substrate-binding protein
MGLLESKDGWREIEAVKTSQVYLCDFDLFTQPSPSTLVDGIELLAALFHSTLFDIPDSLRHKTASGCRTLENKTCFPFA